MFFFLKIVLAVWDSLRHWAERVEEVSLFICTCPHILSHHYFFTIAFLPSAELSSSTYRVPMVQQRLNPQSSAMINIIRVGIGDSCFAVWYINRVWDFQWHSLSL